MGCLFASSLVLVATIACSSADPVDPKKPDACKNVAVSGFIADDGAAEYYWCHAGSGIGAKISCAPSGYQWNNDLQSCVPKAYNDAINMCADMLQAVPKGTWEEKTVGSETLCQTGVKQKTGTSCTLKCDDGYRVINKNNRDDQNQPIPMGDSKSVNCRRQPGRSSQWSMNVEQFLCQDKCKPNPCGNGDCEFKTGKIECTCKDGWKNNVPNNKETPCRTTKNFCDGKTCSSKGYCINELTAYKCICNPGFKGTDCDAQVNCGDPNTELDINDGATATATVSNNYAYNAKVDLECAQGFYITGTDPKERTEKLTCKQSELWETDAGVKMQKKSSAFKVCTQIDCKAPSVLGGNPTASSGTTFGKSGTLTCKTGYELQGSGFTCQGDGTWGPQTCKPKDCGEFTKPANGDVTGTGTVFDTELTVTCKDGFKVKGTTADKTKKVKCLDSGWDSFLGCVIKDCGSPDNLFEANKPKPTFTWDSGSKPQGEIPKDTKVTLKCEDGGANPILIGGDANKKLTCTENGWSPMTSKPECAPAKCPTTNDIDASKGTATFTGKDQTGSATGDPDTTEMKIQCQQGYEIEGQAALTFKCVSEGGKIYWKTGATKLETKPAPTCSKISCEKLDQPANGNYAKLEGVFQEKVALTCNGDRVASPAGTTELTCGNNKKWTPDPSTVKCEEIQCTTITIANGKVMKKGESNAATSFPVGDTFTFSCENGFELSVEAAYEITCSKDGSVGKYSKAVPTCNDIDECSNTDCGEGTCVNGVNDYTCECKAGYKVGTSVGNKKCNTQSNPCENNPCQNNAVCTTNTAFVSESVSKDIFEYKCECQPNTRFSGYKCQKDNQKTIPEDFCTGKTGGSEIMYPDDRGCKRFLKCIFNKTLKEQTCANANEVFDESIDPKKCVDKAIASKESFCTMNTNL